LRPFQEAYLGITNTNEGAIFVNSHRHIDTLEDYVSNAVPTLESVDIQRVVQAYSNITGLDDTYSQAVAVQGERELMFIYPQLSMLTHCEVIFICPTYYLLNAFGSKAHKVCFYIIYQRPPNTQVSRQGEFAVLPGTSRPVFDLDLLTFPQLTTEMIWLITSRGKITLSSQLFRLIVILADVPHSFIHPLRNHSHSRLLMFPSQATST
jgi:hypothetical protein